MFSILNRALSWVITSSGNKFCLKKRSRLIKALGNRFYVKFMQLEIGLFIACDQDRLYCLPRIISRWEFRAKNFLQHFHVILMQLIQYLSASFHVVFMQQFGQYFEQKTHVVWQTGLGGSMGVVAVCHCVNKKSPQRSAILTFCSS